MYKSVVPTSMKTVKTKIFQSIANWNFSCREDKSHWKSNQGYIGKILQLMRFSLVCWNVASSLICHKAAKRATIRSTTTDKQHRTYQYFKYKKIIWAYLNEVGNFSKIIVANTASTAMQSETHTLQLEHCTVDCGPIRRIKLLFRNSKKVV